MIKLIKAFRSEIIAMMGVLAICGLGAALFAWIHIQGQNHEMAQMGTRIENLVAVNKQWAEHGKELNRLRAIEQQNVLQLEAKLAAIEEQNNHTATQLKGLEASNAEVKEYMSRRIPDDLRRLLEQK